MRIILGIDDSPFSESAVRYVKEAVWPKGTRVLVLSAASATPPSLGPGEVIAPQAIAALIDQEEKYHREIADRAATRLRRAGLIAETRVKIGDPRTVLEDAAKAEHADLVVVGSHGRSGLKRLVLGSVAAHVVAHAPCPVLVVKSPRLARTQSEARQAEPAGISSTPLP